MHRLNIKNIFQKTLELNSSSEIVSNFSTNLFSGNSSIHIVAVGKSGSAMLEGAIDTLGKTFSGALLVVKDNPGSRKITHNKLVQVILAGHPIPDENSLYAGKCLIRFCQKLEPNDQILFLISGGASSLVEYIPNSISGLLSISELKKLNKWLLAADKNIMEVNKIRKKVSAIKAGRLLDYIKCKSISALYISDVPDDDLKYIGSGLLIYDDITKAISNIPAWVTDFIRRSEKISKPKIYNDKKINSQIVFSNSLFRLSLVDVAKSFGYDVHNMEEFISGNTINEAIRIAKWLKRQKNGIYIWGAETHMVLPDYPGRGGRNQSFALAMALEIQNMSNIIVLVAGTDGDDGNTNDAGAIIDGQTINRGTQNGVSALECLRNANAGEFLSASDDLLTTGTTGTNVMDIIIALISD